jgi:hypothetical protein
MNELLIFLSAGTSLGILSFGFLLGLKHATEADHLAAVSTIVAQQKGFWRSAGLGALWGLGHTISLIIAGVLVLVLNFQISEQTERILEFFVGIMLCVLGFNVIRKLIKSGKLHLHQHAHGGHEHVHVHTHPHQHDAGHEATPFSPRALIVGMVHGLAGSAALMLLIIPIIDSKLIGMLYILIFGIGSIAGMAIMTFLVGLPFQLTAIRYSRFTHFLQAFAGAVSVALGLWIIYEKGFAGA